MEMTEAKIMRWMILGETGCSSKAMAGVFTGVPRSRDMYGSHPYDPSDFNRCLMLLGFVPECRERLSELKPLSAEWRKLVDRWGEVEQCFLDEAGLGWSHGKSAPKTYALMQEIYKSG